MRVYAETCASEAVRYKTVLDFYGSRAGWETRSPRDPVQSARGVGRSDASTQELTAHELGRRRS